MPSEKDIECRCWKRDSPNHQNNMRPSALNRKDGRPPGDTLMSSQDRIDHGKEVLKTSKEEIARKASYQSPIDKWQFIRLSPNWMIRVTKSHPVCFQQNQETAKTRSYSEYVDCALSISARISD